MDFRRVDVGNATEAVRLLLEELALEEYRFTIGFREPESEVRVEYAASDGWRNATLTVPDSALLRSRQDGEVRSGLATEWRQKLRRAKRRTEPREIDRSRASGSGPRRPSTRCTPRGGAHRRSRREGACIGTEQCPCQRQVTHALKE
jgi:hypothetical protein